MTIDTEALDEAVRRVVPKLTMRQMLREQRLYGTAGVLGQRPVTVANIRFQYRAIVAKKREVSTRCPR